MKTKSSQQKENEANKKVRVRQRTQENTSEDVRWVWADAQNHIRCHVKCT